MGKERHKITPATYLFLIKDSKVFLCRRCNTGFRDGEYGLIAGHLNGNETIRQAMCRESKEEAGLNIEPDDLNLVHVMNRFSDHVHERVDFFFTLKSWKGEPQNAEPNKCDDIRWFPLDQLPENTIDCIRHFIECYKQGEIYSEFGW